MWREHKFLKTFLDILLLGALAGPSFRVLAAMSLGINYGKVANNILAPAEVVTLIQSISITKARIYDPDPLVLTTFRNTDISFLVGVANEDLANLGSLGFSTSWIQKNVLPYYPSTHISGIVVGNEIFTGTDTAQMSRVLPAMKNIYSALSSLKLQKKILVSTTHSFGVLTASYPPSSGAFNPAIADTYIRPILQFHAQTGGPFMVNAYPFFAYEANVGEISLDYVLFRSTVGSPDPKTGLVYYNMFDAQVDAVYSAIALLGYNNISILVSETGWPSAGDANEAGANPENAQIYHTNLFKHVHSSRGTPLWPNRSMDVYLFALFNENLKPGPKSERHYGLFQPDGTKAYGFNFSQSSSASDQRSWMLGVELVLFAYLVLMNLLCRMNDYSC